MDDTDVASQSCYAASGITVVMKARHGLTLSTSVIFINENENENEKMMKTKTKLKRKIEND